MMADSSLTSFPLGLTTVSSLPPSAMATDQPKEKSKRQREFWLNAWRDHLAGIKSFSSCLDLADVNGDGDYKLLVADSQKRLKVYSGTCLAHDQKLLTVPTAVASYYMDYREEVRRPNVAVASGPFIFIFKNLKPFYKYMLPQVDVAPQEQEAWASLKKDPEANHARVVEVLEGLKDTGKQLTSASIEYLGLEDTKSRSEYVSSVEVPLVQMTVTTCMAVLRKDKDEPTALSCLVIGTENSKLLILDGTGSAIHKKIPLPDVPVHILTTGLLDVEYRIIVSCRNGNVYAVKNGELSGVVLEVGSQPVALARIESQVVIGTMSNTLHYFHLKGKKQGVVYLPAPISDMCSMYMESTRSSKAIIVALANGEVRVYVGKALMNTTQVYDVVTGMTFGRYGREDSTLVLTLKSGSIAIKMLPRTASLEPHKAHTEGPPPEQDIPLKVPKRTELYVQQTAREKEFGVDMHRIFQRDLYKLRLIAARAYAKVLTSGQGTMSHNVGSSLRLTASVQGLGPLFKVKLIVQNTGNKALTGIPVVFTYNQSIYSVPRPYLLIPALVPSLVYNFEIAVECVDEEAGADVIRVYVCHPTSSIPIITAIVNMPLADFLMSEAQ